VPVLFLLLSAAVIAFGAVSTAPQAPDERSTADGVYTRVQADAGRDLWAMACQSCHAPTQHSGATFKANWYGRSLGELLVYLRREMPKNEPGTLSDSEYVTLIAYLMRVNRMPAGQAPLAADSLTLHRIRIDSLPSAARDSSVGANTQGRAR
jgi:mono/diheme cytochrome c family protein